MGGLEAGPRSSRRLPQTGSGPLRVLCIGAHADDIEIGCGGTLLTWIAARPVEVRWVVFSAVGVRRNEAEAGARTLLDGAAAHRVELHEFPDGDFPSARSSLKAAFRSLAETGDPHVVFTHRERDLHQDHATLAALTREAFRDHLILSYEVPKYDGDLETPNLYVPLDDAARRRKLAVLREAFPSQASKHWFDDSTFDGLMRLRGVECASPSGYAEAFHVRKAWLEP